MRVASRLDIVTIFGLWFYRHEEDRARRRGSLSEY